jgi:hypothetical protein
MMTSVQLHKSYQSQPELGLIAFWGVITRDISNCSLGNYRI